MSVSTRFAPSPTGMLHIGSARTALFSWLHAKANSGQFILRIEDTDRERSTDEAVQVILDGMDWLGLHHDVGPIYQTQRSEIYKQYIDKLLAENKAYRCYCSKERLDKLREEQMAAKQKPRYDGHCRNLTENQDGSYVIRFKNPQSGIVEFQDAVHGLIKVNNEELDDLIIARSDGTPTYNFCVVIDDMEMGVTDVIRGDDHINNTPRQINLFKALDKTPPNYAHIPMILGPDGKKLSKRFGAASVLEFREQGYLPEALLNYLVRLGWSHGDQEIFSVDDMIGKFSLTAVNKSAAAINPDKLLWLNQHYIKNLPAEQVGEELAWHLNKMPDVNLSSGPDLKDVVLAQQERAKTLVEMAEKSAFLYRNTVNYAEKAVKHLNQESKQVLETVSSQLELLSDWNCESIHLVIKNTTELLNTKMGKVAQPIRVAVTGNTISPSIDVTLDLLGRQKTLTRLKAALTYIKSG